MTNNKVLIDLGFSGQESETYLSLLKLGGSIASTVAKDIGVKRTTIYPILKNLASKGIVSVYFKKNKRFYHAIKPHKISSLFEKKIELFNNLIPALESIEKKQAQTIGLRFIETQEELENFYNDILDEYKNYKTKEYYVIGSTPNWEGVDKEYFEQFRKDRGKHNIKTKLLLTHESKDSNPTERSLLREFKYIPEKYPFKSTIDIYKDKVIIIGPDISSLAVVIAIPAMVDIFKSVFEIIWDTLPTK